jgi:hypothetical protein
MTRKIAIRFGAGMAAYVLLTVLGALLVDRLDPPTWARGLLVLGPVLAAVYAVGSQVTGIRSREGMERTVLTDAAALAFFVTVLAALAYGFLQGWAHAPALSMFWVWGFGMGAWLVTSLVISRRYR